MCKMSCSYIQIFKSGPTDQLMDVVTQRVMLLAVLKHNEWQSKIQRFSSLIQMTQSLSSLETNVKLAESP